MSSAFSNEDVGVLSNLRSDTTRGIRSNFHQIFRNNLSCPQKCWSPSDAPLRDTQEHLLVCSKLNLATQTVVRGNIKYENIYGNVEDQKAIVNIFKELIEKRNKLLKPDPTSGS